VAPLDELRAKPGLSEYVLQASGEPLCIVSHAGTVSALHDLCPHKLGLMHLGDIEDAPAHGGACVKCPRHRKKFNGGLNFCVTDGSSWARQPTLERSGPFLAPARVRRARE
jgi:nitrite reductase/ring-hydroxylating ferredoxin subunit